MLCKVSANDRRRYICNIYTHWTRTCSTIYRQTTGPALWFSLPCILCRYSVVILTYQIHNTWLTINHIDYLWFGQFSQWVTVSCYILLRCWQHAVVRNTVYTITYPHGFVCFVLSRLYDISSQIEIIPIFIFFMVSSLKQKYCLWPEEPTLNDVGKYLGTRWFRYPCTRGCVFLHHSCTWYMDHSVYRFRQSETTLHCNVVSHWLSPYTEWSLRHGRYAMNIPSSL